MNTKDKYKLIFFILLIYIFNSGHIAQQDIYLDYYIPLANSILESFSYTINDVPYSYPMWGYSIILSLMKIIYSYNLILLFQLVLCYFSIKKLYDIFKVKFKNFQLILLLPIIALSTVKWSDAIVASLLIFYFYNLYKTLKNNSIKDNLIAGLLLGLILNFRSEYILIIPIQIVIILLIKSVRQNVNKTKHSVIYLTTFLVILPWGIRNYITFEEFKITSSNGAAVMYISLGQLPENKWNIVPKDESAYKAVRKKGVKEAFSLKGEKILKKEFYKLVEKEPFEYIKKMVNNSLNIVIGGVYTGEYGSLLIPKNERIEIDNKINKSKGIDKFETIIDQKMQVKYLLMSEKIILIFYRLIWFIIIVLFVYYLLKMRKDEMMILILILLIHKILIVAMVQYEYRHINSIYPFLTFYVLSKLSSKV